MKLLILYLALNILDIISLNLNCFNNLQKKADVAIIPLMNSIAALRKGKFDVTRSLIGIERLPPEVPGFEVNLQKAIVWIIRETHLHGSLPDDLLFNLKIDGRPFFGE